MHQVSSLSDRLVNVQLLNSHLHVGRRRRPERIRSLPAEVVEALYEMLDPESSSNPFVGAASRWRVYTIFMLLLHQGLRRGELLSFPVDVIKSAFDRKQQQVRYWMDVRYNQYENEDSHHCFAMFDNTFGCSKVLGWGRDMSQEEIESGRDRDQKARVKHFKKPKVALTKPGKSKRS